MKSVGIKTIFVILATAAIFFGGWKYAERDRVGEDGKPLQSVKSSNFEAGNVIISQLNKLEKVTFDEAFFKSQVFLSFIDFTINVVQEDQGRSNPFAPIGGVTPPSPTPRR